MSVWRLLGGSSPNASVFIFGRPQARLDEAAKPVCGGSIVLVSSVMHGMGIPGHAAYAATRAALRSCAGIRRQRVRDGIELVVDGGNAQVRVPLVTHLNRRALINCLSYCEYIPCPISTSCSVPAN